MSNSSVEVYRGSDAEMVSTSESPETAPTPKKKRRTGRVTFNLPSADSDTDYYEEPDSPQRLLSPIKRTPVLKRTEHIPVMGNEKMPNSEKLNDLNEPSLAELEALYSLDLEDRNYLASLGRGRGRHAKNTNQPRLKENLRPNIIIRPPECCPEEWEQLEKEARELDEEERKIRDMKAGRGRGPLQSRKYNGRPPVTIKKEIPHCHALPLSLSSRGACHDPLPVVILLAVLEYRDSAEDMDKDRVNTFKPC